jgi:transcriptional regulator with XRE-family HTH domain
MNLGPKEAQGDEELNWEGLGQRLRAARETAGYRQEDVAEWLGISRPTVVAIESGKTRIHSLFLRRLATLYRRELNSFFLGRQNVLEQLVFEIGEVGGGVAAEAVLRAPGGVALVEGGAQGPPLLEVAGLEVDGGDRPGARDDGGDQPDGAAHDEGWTGQLAPGRPAFQVTGRAEEMLQVIVGARQVGDVVAGEEAGPIACRHLEEVVERRGERADLAARAGQRCQECVVARPNLGTGLLVVGGQDVRGLMDDGVSRAHLGPEGSSGLQAVGQDPLETGEGPGQPLFSRTRSIEARTASRRPTSLSPEAARGGRPSSVRALRTAWQ